MKAKPKKRPVHQIRIIVEKHPGYYVAYPLGIKGACVGEGASYDEALADVKGAIKSHIAAFGEDVLDDLDSTVSEVFIAETKVSV